MSAIEELSKIKGKPVDAMGHVVFCIDFEHFKSPFCIEKIFGLVDMKTNTVFKFKLVMSEDGLKNFKLKLTYISEDPIDCKIKIGNQQLEILEHLTSSDEAKIWPRTHWSAQGGCRHPAPPDTPLPAPPE